MAVEGASKLIKYLMFFFNFIFFICGIVIIVGGALVFTKYNDYVDFTGSMGNAIPIVLLVIGIFILFTGFLGCCGALRENYCMVCTFAIIIVILLLAELGGGIAGYVLRNDIKKAIDDNMNKLLVQYPNNTATQKLFDSMQQDLKCCGVNNYTDWYSYLGSGNVTDSCCKKEEPKCGIEPKKETIWTDGCFNALYDFLEDNIVIIAAIAIVIAVIQIFGVVCSCCLMRSIKGEYEVV
ncbi:CD63 antigen-like [Acanthaster planci]|uniref:Tetraspanin n=1 Tax=Acanthaster planci TaxID=133434 RepID=A0A8B8A4T8_ACAPL|nr:CD63 antigen-like [Acanthaster planci]